MLVDHVDAFGHLRSPFRATTLAQVSLAVLAALGIDTLWSGPSRTLGPAAVGVALVLAVATTDLGPGHLVALPDHDTRWIDWLSDHPGGAVVALPPAPGPDEEDFEATTAAMVQSLEHGHPLVNGYSAFFPSRDEVLRERLAAFPTDAIVQKLRREHVSYAIADSDWWDAERAARAQPARCADGPRRSRCRSPRPAAEPAVDHQVVETYTNRDGLELAYQQWGERGTGRRSCSSTGSSPTAT